MLFLFGNTLCVSFAPVTVLRPGIQDEDDDEQGEGLDKLPEASFLGPQQ